MFKKQKEEKMIIGYYSKSVFITYLGVISATIGMFLAFNHKITYLNKLEKTIYSPLFQRKLI